MPIRPIATFLRWTAFALMLGGLAACQSTDLPKDMAPLSREVEQRIVAIGSTPASPIYVRLFKEESEFEVWKRRPDGTYALMKTYAICTWSGQLGPKLAEGDRQAPEGFYIVGPGQMNPNSSYYLSFNIGFPNAYDAAWGRTGSHLMVHGACSSAGCYSMTDEQMGEIYALVREAFRGGQRTFQVAAFPFRMTPENMARHRDNSNMPFWEMLKEGYDHFEVTRRVPDVQVCDRRYVFNAEARRGQEFDPLLPCPDYEVPEEIAVAVAAKQEADAIRFEAEVARLEAAESGGAVAATATEAADQAAGSPPADDPGVDETTTASAFSEEGGQDGNFITRLFGGLFGD
ncbi:MAG: murein L,D-transpeptidase [Bauldia sp.]|nr:murein L,D-transpeptidase [Bauldia sp.]